ncbi:MAG: hypothetical protein EXS13_00120 [Planctomycetes bacterium]|nr:hypothetical protein [Planctomycetota bacterium]
MGRGKRWSRGGLAVVVGAVVAAAAPEAPAQQAAPGFGLDEVVVAPGGFVGGFELLANGDYALFDGTAVQQVSSVDGSVVQTLFTPPGFVFGAFLRNSPDGATLYFGESSNHEIWAIDLATLQAQVVLTVTFPFDLAFDPQGQPFVTWSLGFFQGSHVSLCDFVTGTIDDVVDSPEASGPLFFDADGDLWTALPDFSSYPPTRDATELIRIDAANLAAAIGPGAYDATLAPVIAQLDGAYGLVQDDGGDLIVSDANYGTIVAVDPANGAESIVAEAGGFEAFAYLCWRDQPHGVFEPWQPADAGELIAVRTDYFSENAVTRVRPARPMIATNPPSPVPAGPFDLDLTGATPDGFALLYVSAGLAPNEFALRNRTWPAPLYFDLDFVGLQFHVLALDSSGEFHETLTNSGFGGIDLAAQFVTAASLGGPYFGTSEAIVVTLQ